MKVSGTNGSDFQMPEPGTYAARCVKLVDLGTQGVEYDNKPAVRRQVVVEWELPTELIEGGEWAGMPMTVRKFYNRTIGEGSNLRKDLTNWRGRNFTPDELECFDIEAILGAPCQLTLSATDNGRRKITAVSKLMKGTVVPKQVHPSVVFDLDAFNPEVHEGLSEWFRATIAKSPEYRRAMSGETSMPCGSSSADDAIPF